MIVIERSIAFGEDNHLIGTLCLPSATEVGKPAIGQILFNAGIVHRIGPHRINVRLARTLARHGIPSIRFDLGGLGDSARPSANVSYEMQAVLDIQSAMDALGAATNLRRFSLFGYCSGAHHGYATALVDERVVGLILYDAFFYRTIWSRLNRYLIPIRRSGLLRVAGRWIARQPHVLSRRIRIWRGQEREALQPAEYSALRSPPKADFARSIRLLIDRRVKVGLMYSGGSRDYNYHDQFRDALRGFDIEELVTYDYFPWMDHTATIVAAQAKFMERIVEWAVKLAKRYGEELLA